MSHQCIAWQDTPFSSGLPKSPLLKDFTKAGLMPSRKSSCSTIISMRRGTTSLEKFFTRAPRLQNRRLPFLQLIKRQALLIQIERQTNLEEKHTILFNFSLSSCTYFYKLDAASCNLNWRVYCNPQFPFIITLYIKWKYKK